MLTNEKLLEEIRKTKNPTIALLSKNTKTNRVIVASLIFALEAEGRIKAETVGNVRVWSVKK